MNPFIHTRRRAFGRLAVAGLLVAATACGGSDSGKGSADGTSPAGTTATAATDTAAVETTEATTTTVPVPDGPTLTEVSDATIAGPTGATVTPVVDLTLAPGSAIATAAASATLTWPDGSITRLAPGSRFTIGDGMDSRGELASGRVWNRVATQAAGSTYTVTTPVGTLTAKGTAFVVSCVPDELCGVTVLEGTVTATPEVGAAADVTAATTTKIGLDGVQPATPVNWDMAFGDPWVLESADADAAADFPTAAELATAIGPSFASVEGSYLAIRTVVDCQPDPAICTGSRAIGDVAERTYTFALDCSAGYPCQGTAITEFSQNGQSATETVPVTFDGTTLTWARDAMEPSCTDDTGVGHGTTHSVITWTLTPAAAEPGDGKYVMSGGTGTVTASNERIDLADCIGDPRSYTQVSEIEILGRV